MEVICNHASKCENIESCPHGRPHEHVFCDWADISHKEIFYCNDVSSVCAAINIDCVCVPIIEDWDK